MSAAPCRICGTPVDRVFVDLGMSPLANSFVDPHREVAAESFYPLCARVCEECLLVQLPVLESPQAIFADYAYFSSFATTWVEHCRVYAERMVERLGLGPASRVVEIASNDGCLLRFFQQRDVPVLGIEPAANVARAAEEAGVPTRVEFFGGESARRLAAAGEGADLLVGNNVLAHVPDLNDFVAGLRIALRPGGVTTLEFPHLMRLIAENQFDTIYHEHFSYLSLGTVHRLFAAHGLEIFDVEELPTHGGSLRVFARREADGGEPPAPAVAALLAVEEKAGLRRIDSYLRFEERVRETKRRLLEFLIARKRAGRTIVAYGAPAKGNTLLNYCGIGRDFIDYTVDRNPHKQGLLLPGSRIPIHPPERIFATRPDDIFILPWNLEREIVEQMSGVAAWGGRLFVAIPEVRVLE